MNTEESLINSTNPNMGLWHSLTTSQQEEVLIAYEESEDESNLIPVSAIIEKNSKSL